MNKIQDKPKKNHLAEKIRLYNEKLEQKKASKENEFKAKKQAKISREHARWDNKAADFSARKARWDKKWERRKAEWETKK